MLAAQCTTTWQASGVTDLPELRRAIRDFVDERDWRQFHDPKSLILALVGEVGELAELYQWLPADRAAALATQEPLRTRESPPNGSYGNLSAWRA